MGFLERLFAPSAEKAHPFGDVAFGDAGAASLRAAVAAGKWREAQDVLEGCRDWGERGFLVDVLASIPGRPPCFDEWIDAAPGSAVALLASGAHGVSWAWEARSARVAALVSKSAATTFFARLTTADSELERAVALDPADPTPWALMTVTGRGLELELDQVRERFEQAVRRDPGNRRAHAGMLTALCWKWLGSHEQMFDFAHATSACAPEGSGLHALVAQAHVERWLAFGMEDEAQGKGGYFAQPEVHGEVQWAWDQSVASPEHRESRYTPHDRNHFAFCFWKAGDKVRAAAELRAIGRKATKMPWGLDGDPKSAHARALRDCGLDARALAD
jgi:hypothetical protein